ALVTDILLNEAKALGAKLEYPITVTGFAREGDRVSTVQTDQGAVQVSDVVLAAGLGCTRLAEMLGSKVPVKSSEGLLAHTEVHSQILERVVLAPNSTIKQNPDGTLVVGESFAATVGIAPTREFGEMV